ncbi:MAG: hypothetical protein KJ981_18875 [Alphaproteobacteria bacterium]|nr:hypothetical protein [Alphaproteobacteria bacterium]MBU0833707.1 hypothetical protein [Alphaproteobacteria bacterium]MBU1765949.1 hypothetical protein [Alphaproteobacteria bacterium]
MTELVRKFRAFALKGFEPTTSSTPSLDFNNLGLASGIGCHTHYQQMLTTVVSLTLLSTDRTYTEDSIAIAPKVSRFGSLGKSTGGR